MSTLDELNARWRRRCAEQGITPSLPQPARAAELSQAQIDRRASAWVDAYEREGAGLDWREEFGRWVESVPESLRVNASILSRIRDAVHAELFARGLTTEPPESVC